MWAVCLHICQRWAIDLNKPLLGCISLPDIPRLWTAKDFVVIFDCIAVGSLDVFTSRARQRWRSAVCHNLAGEAFPACPPEVTLIFKLSCADLNWIPVSDARASFFFFFMQMIFVFLWHLEKNNPLHYYLDNDPHCLYLSLWKMFYISPSFGWVYMSCRQTIQRQG